MIHRMGTIKADDAELGADTVPVPPPITASSPVVRWLLVVAGWTLVAIGIAGIFLPVLPTTVFLIGALWAFTRSSRRFQVWLWTHPMLGPPVRAWEMHGVIPTRAKILAGVVMAISYAYVTIWVAEDWKLPTLLGVVMGGAMIYIATRPGRPPEGGDET